MATLSQHYPAATAAPKDASGKGKGKAAAVAAPPSADADEQAQAELTAFDLDSVRWRALRGLRRQGLVESSSRGVCRR
jgi:hypothetical protein